MNLVGAKEWEKVSMRVDQRASMVPKVYYQESGGKWAQVIENLRIRKLTIKVLDVQSDNATTGFIFRQPQGINFQKG